MLYLIRSACSMCNYAIYFCCKYGNIFLDYCQSCHKHAVDKTERKKTLNCYYHFLLKGLKSFNLFDNVSVEMLLMFSSRPDLDAVMELVLLMFSGETVWG